MDAPRSAEQRKTDTMARLASDADAWIATADADGNGYLLPLSFLWDGTGLVVATPRSSVAGRNLVYSAVMEGQRTLPGREINARLYDAFQKAGL